MLNRLVGWLGKAWMRYQTRKELEALSDRMLNDIGLRRDEIARL